VDVGDIFGDSGVYFASIFRVEVCNNQRMELTSVVNQSKASNNTTVHITNSTIALGSTQPLTEMSTRNLPGGKGRQAHKAENLTAICQHIVQKLWEPGLLTTLWASTACYRG
jgi:hypothetical protein